MLNLWKWVCAYSTLCRCCSCVTVSWLAWLTMTSVKNITTDQATLLGFKVHVADPRNILANNWSISYPVYSWVDISCGARHHRSLQSFAYGSIPPHLGNLSFSVFLNFRQNNFHGLLPNELCQLHRLKIISLAYNKLSGSFPLWISIFSKFQILSLRNNSLIGRIPDSLFNLSKLDESSTYQSWRSWTPGSIILMEIFLQRLQIWVCLRFWIWETTTYKVHIPQFPLLHIVCFYLNFSSLPNCEFPNWPNNAAKLLRLKFLTNRGKEIYLWS